jgi:dihydrofolate reductase
MTRLVGALTMSLDGFIARPDDSVGPLFDWYEAGPVEFQWPGNPMTSHVTEASARYLRATVDEAGAIIVGRRVFDYTGGWGGHHPMGVPVFLLSHSVPDGWPRPDVPVTIVTDGLASAVEQAAAVAGDKAVAVCGPNVIQQCLDAGLLDELRVELAPVLLGEGIRFFGELAHPPVLLDNPIIMESDRVTHLCYHVRR